MNYVERFILEEGHTCHRMFADYGYDLFMVTYDERGYVEPDLVYLQLKATDALAPGRKPCFDLDVRDYNLWRWERMPVILVLFDATSRKGYWVCVQEYLESMAIQPRVGATTIRIHLQRRQVLSRRAIATMRTLKREARRVNWR